jgi:hypothetical protein
MAISTNDFFVPDPIPDATDVTPSPLDGSFPEACGRLRKAMESYGR